MFDYNIRCKSNKKIIKMGSSMSDPAAFKLKNR